MNETYAFLRAVKAACAELELDGCCYYPTERVSASLSAARRH